jgi:predicted nucleic acid-binding Zn ribbon protein
MPTYVYETIPSDPKQAPRRFEIEQRMTAAALTHDPETGLPVRRVISGGLGFTGFAEASSSCGSGGCGMTTVDAPCGTGGGCALPDMGHACHPGCRH